MNTILSTCEIDACCNWLLNAKHYDLLRLFIEQEYISADRLFNILINHKMSDYSADSLFKLFDQTSISKEKLIKHFSSTSYMLFPENYLELIEYGWEPNNFHIFFLPDDLFLESVKVESINQELEYNIINSYLGGNKININSIFWLIKNSANDDYIFIIEVLVLLQEKSHILNANMIADLYLQKCPSIQADYIKKLSLSRNLLIYIRHIYDIINNCTLLVTTLNASCSSIKKIYKELNKLDLNMSIIVLIHAIEVERGGIIGIKKHILSIIDDRTEDLLNLFSSRFLEICSIAKTKYSVHWIIDTLEKIDIIISNS